MTDVSWEVSGGGEQSSTTKKKMVFLTPIKITENMDENQKTFFTNYNNMQKELIKNGLMESK